MFFKRASKDKAIDAGPEVAAANDPAPSTSAATPGTGPSLDFKTTAELEPENGVIGQERALKAILFGVEMKGPGFNIFVCGPAGCGKRSAVLAVLEKIAAEAPPPSEWVYVTNFEDARRPHTLKFPAGRAKPFAQAMAGSVDELRATLPAAFGSEDTQSRRRSIDEVFRAVRDGALEALNQKAAAQNIAILRTPSGYTLAPMHEGKVVKPEVFNQIPETMRQQVEARVDTLQRELEKILVAEPKAEQSRRMRLVALNEDVARLAVDAAFGDVKAAYADLPDIAGHLALAESDVVRNAAVFVAAEQNGGSTMRLPIAMANDSPFRRYLANVLLAGAEAQTGAPITEETNPAPAGILGRVVQQSGKDSAAGDILCLQTGALHRANGGYLMMDARELQSSTAAWAALKRSLKAGHVAIEPRAESTWAPEPIPLDVKVILFGTTDLYEQLSQQDPHFARLFQVRAEFAERIENNAGNHRAFARLIAGIVKRHGLRAVDAAGVAGVIEEAVRMAGDQNKLCVEIGRISDVVREANHWAGKAGREIISREDVARALEERAGRSRGLPGSSAS